MSASLSLGGASEQLSLSHLGSSFDIAAILQSAESSAALQLPDPSAVNVVARAGAFRIETVWNGRKVRGPRRSTHLEAEQDKMVIEQAKASGSMDQVLAEWQVNCQVLPKGVYYHKEKKAFVATICITPSRFSSMYHAPGRNSKKYDGPSRKTAEEALADRERMAAAKDEEELLQILREIRGPHARGEKKTGHPAEVVPQGVYYKPDTGTYQAQVSVNRKNVRGPPRTSLQEAIVDRQRLLIAKANNQAEQESLELKMEYQRRLSMADAAVTGGMGTRGMGGGGGLEGEKKRGRPRGSMGIARRTSNSGNGSGAPFDFTFPVLSESGNPAFSFLLASTAAAAASGSAPPLPMSLLFPPSNALMAQFLPSGAEGVSLLPADPSLQAAMHGADLGAGTSSSTSPRLKRLRKDEDMTTNNNSNNNSSNHPLSDSINNSANN